MSQIYSNLNIFNHYLVYKYIWIFKSHMAWYTVHVIKNLTNEKIQELFFLFSNRDPRMVDVCGVPLSFPCWLQDSQNAWMEKNKGFKWYSYWVLLPTSYISKRRGYNISKIHKFGFIASLIRRILVWILEDWMP